jgi:RNAse (barnase) inhibitor barstar
MHNHIKMVVTNKKNSIQNIKFLINTVSNISQRIKNSSLYSRNLNALLDKISNPITELLTNKDLETIDMLAQEFFTKDFSNKVFLQRDMSNKLLQLWKILNEIYDYNPAKVVDCVNRILDKKMPMKLSETEKAELSNHLLSKFFGTSKRVNAITDFIFDHVKHDRETHSLDVLSICGMLLSFVVNPNLIYTL